MGKSDLGPAVADGRLRYVSPSQITKYDADGGDSGCPRRWWFIKVAHKEDPSGPAAKLGEAVHAQIEHYLLTGEDVLGPIARAGKHMLPAPKSKIVVEAKVEYASSGASGILSPVEAAGVPVVGRIDLVDGNGPANVIVDHKTTSSIYHKKLEMLFKGGLGHDTQMQAYALWAQSQGLARDGVIKLRHNYLQTKKENGEFPTDKLESSERLTVIGERWQSHVVPVVTRMVADAGKANPLDVAENKKACNAFGKRCPFYSTCFPSTEVTKVAGLLSQIQKMKQQSVSQAAPVPPPTPAPAAPIPSQGTSTPAPSIVQKEARPIQGPLGVTLSPVAMTMSGLRFSPQQQQALGIDEWGIPLKKLAVVDTTEGWSPGDAKALPPAFPSPLPPDAPASHPEIAAACQACEAAGKPNLQHFVKDCPTRQVAAPVAEGEPVKKKRGRPPKVTPSPAVAAGEIPASGANLPQTPVAPAGPSGAADKPESVADTSEPLHLFVDCIPNGEYEDLTPWVMELSAKVAAEFSVPDIGLVEFGKGQAALRALAKASPPTGPCFIQSGGLSGIVAEVLIPMAAYYVRGVR